MRQRDLQLLGQFTGTDLASRNPRFGGSVGHDDWAHQHAMNGKAANSLRSSAAIKCNDPTDEHLIYLTRILFAAVYQDQGSLEYQHLLAQPMIIEHADTPVYDKRDLLGHWKALKRRCPEIHAEILNATCERVGDYATVWCWVDLRGMEGGLRREAVAILFWEFVRDGDGDGEKRKGSWVCTRHKGLRSISGT